MAPSEQIRRIIERSPLTPYRLAELAGVPKSVLSRFLAGKRTMTLTTLDALAPFLEIAITPRRDGRARREAAKAPKRGRPRAKKNSARISE